MSTPNRPRPVVLCILDGWGERAQRDGNAILQARTPNWNRFMARFPHSHMQASEHFVGLPDHQMGNSEVGHTNIGAGRVVKQDLPRIDDAIKRGEVSANPAFRDFVAAMKTSGGTVHLMGLISPGGVHSHQDQIAALANLLAAQGLNVNVHAFLDGRDTPPRSARDYVAAFERTLEDRKRVHIATVAGRYFAMDRDRRWDRVEKAYRALVMAEGPRAADAHAAIERSYSEDKGDEFVAPTVIGEYAGMKDGDGVACGNFRADRVRQLLLALLDPRFAAFKRLRTIQFVAALGMTQYSGELDRLMKTLFPPEDLADTLGEVVARAGLKQLRIAETEKYAHVTFFFNGGRETEFDGESRILVPSPQIATYDLKPEMSAFEVTDKLVASIDSGQYDFVVVNYANTDMVGHTGDVAAAIRAVEAVAQCLGRVAAAVERVGGCLLITADHGNAEQMRDPETGGPHTAHTTNPVPLVLVNPPPGVDGLRDGKLADIAPTVLSLMRLPQPKAMTGQNLARAATRVTA